MQSNQLQPNAKRHRDPDAPGMVHVYTGDAKGKTSCAIGMAVRASGAGLRVLFLQFDKGFIGENYYSEHRALALLPGIAVVTTGCQRMLDNGRFRFRNLDEDFAEAQRGLQIAREALKNEDRDLIILDEAVTSVQTQLLRADEIEALLDLHDERPRAELVLTGRGAWPALLERADLVTEMTLHKHYFTQGVRLRRGIDH